MGRDWLLRLGVCLLLALTVLASDGQRVQAHDDSVLIIGDSIATGMLWHPKAVSVMEKDLSVDWQIEICRTLTGVSCPFDGKRPPTLLDLVTGMGHVPPVVVVEMGYNDPEETFAADVDTAMSALVAAGAQHVLWLTLRAARDPYPALNVMLHQATSRWPQLQLIDWDAASSNQWGWFQSDGVHLLEPGAVAMAQLVHAAVLTIVNPLRILAPPRPRVPAPPPEMASI